MILARDGGGPARSLAAPRARDRRVPTGAAPARAPGGEGLRADARSSSVGLRTEALPAVGDSSQVAQGADAAPMRCLPREVASRVSHPAR